MHCPACYEKKKTLRIKLEVARTYANYNNISRDRRCPKCKTTFKTTERLDSVISEERTEHKDAVYTLDAERRELQAVIEEVRESTQTLIDFARGPVKLSADEKVLNLKENLKNSLIGG